MTEQCIRNCGWLEKNKIIEKFPYLCNLNTNITGIVIGNDLDALLSAFVLKNKFNWNVVGIYDLENLWFDKNLTIGEFKTLIKNHQLLWIDLDIYNKDIPSIGHHILEYNENDKLLGHKNSLNPNLIRGIGYKNFYKKYPLGTVHFLIWLLDISIEFNRFTKLLLWMIDSAFINGQRYTENVHYWLKNCVNIDFMLDSFSQVQGKAFEFEIKNMIYTKMYNIGIKQGFVQKRSKYLQLGGYQCQWKNPEKELSIINELLKLIAKESKLEIPHFPRKYNLIKLSRKTGDINRIICKYKCLDNFLTKEKIFSYAITNRNVINYTKSNKISKSKFLML